jgi:hypothetical protein
VRLRRSSQKKAKGLENRALRSVKSFLSMQCPCPAKYNSLLSEHKHGRFSGVSLSFQSMELHKPLFRSITRKI